MVTPSGLPVLVECKLWRNPEGRREVVGQILDYAKELSRWTSSDVQREVSRCLKVAGNPLLEKVRTADPEVDEVRFIDALTFNLRRGRFLLLIVGDGIREGVEAIADYLQLHAGLHFSMGLVELPVYLMPDGSRLVAPRNLVRTKVITRTVVSVPDGYVLEDENSAVATRADPEGKAQADRHQRFWGEFLSLCRLDDPEQPVPKPARGEQVYFMLPSPGGSSWLTVFRDEVRGEIGIFLSCSRNTAGEYALEVIMQDWDAVRLQLGGTARLIEINGQQRASDKAAAGDLDQPASRSAAFAWMAERVNTFVNVLRARVRSAAADYQERKD